MELDSIEVLQEGLELELLQQSGAGLPGRIEIISLFSADEKNLMQQSLNSALKNRNSLFE